MTETRVAIQLSAQRLRGRRIAVTGAYIVLRCCPPWLKQAACSTIVNLGAGQSLLPNAPDRNAYSTSH